MSAAERWDDFSNYPALLTAKEVGDILRIKSVKTVYTRMRRGQIPGVIKTGKRGLLVRKKDLLRFLEQGRVPSNTLEGE